MISNSSSDVELLEFAKFVSADRSVPLVAQLAKALAESGTMLPRSEMLTADLASTGGPTSLSTLVAPLHLRAAGAIVPKLGVPGRPAGGIDCLAQIPGYKYRLTAGEVKDVLDKCGFAHFLAAGEMAPLDGRLFRLRQQSNLQNVPVLAVASILAKKIAVGVLRAGLDIRVAPWGNFGSTSVEASWSARLFREVSAIHSIEATTFLTDGTRPYQPYLGRAESLLAMGKIFRGEACPWLEKHARDCMMMAASTLSVSDVGLEKSANHLRAVFKDHLVAQGTTIDAFDELVDSVEKAHRYQIVAESDGYLAVDLVALRDALVGAQHDFSGMDDQEFPDPVGVHLLMDVGTLVTSGDVLATARVGKEATEKYMSKLRAAFRLMSAGAR